MVVIYVFYLIGEVISLLTLPLTLLSILIPNVFNSVSTQLLLFILLVLFLEFDSNHSFGTFLYSSSFDSLPVFVYM